jgi:anti-sigma regulatory factor (Ser/Thr protein kinase)
VSGITVPSTLDALEAVATFVIDAAEQAALDERATYKLRLAVDEIVTNVVTHGHRSAENQTLHVSAEILPDRLRIRLTDSGSYYDPRQCPPPTTLHAPPDTRTTGGLGIFLVFWAVDEFTYESTPQGNCTTFVVRRTRQNKDAPNAANIDAQQ